MAQKHSVLTAGDQAPAGATATPLPAMEQLQQSAKVLAATEAEAPAYSAPQLQLSSPMGIVASTPANAVFSASATSSLTAVHDIDFALQGNSYAVVKDGIKLVTYGKVTNPNKPNQGLAYVCVPPVARSACRASLLERV